MINQTYKDFLKNQGEKKWQKTWEDRQVFKVSENQERPKYYILDMFPYPSSAGLHVGHPEGYTATDIVSRYYRMKGKNVLHPMGFDAFGLPTENYAIKVGKNPKEISKENIKNFTRQLKSFGFSYDWGREVNTSDPRYYKWTQWMFCQFYKAGLAYKKQAPVNWCESCKTVLAREQVIDGKCERCKNQVIQKNLSQWFFKTTKYADELLNDVEKLDWPESIKALQRNWIGKSEGAEIDFEIKDGGEKIKVFTTRPDTLFGATYIVLAPEHKLVKNLESRILNFEEVEKYIKETKKKNELERTELNKGKTGVELKGVKAINPADNKEIPIFIADYVLASYGTGAIMAVPAHDERDYEFAKKFDLEIRQVVAPLFRATSGSFAVRNSEPTFHRKMVYVFLKHHKENKFLCLNWKKEGWRAVIAGGIDDGEYMIKAAEREIQEETGYKNVKFMKKFGCEFHNNFFALNKNENRYSIGQGLLFELVDDKNEKPAQEELDVHEPIWIDENKLDEFFNLSNHKFMLKQLRDDSTCFCGEGILINSNKFDGLEIDEAKQKITAWLEKNNFGKNAVSYKLRDWLISRQRYWGAPIPIIYCPKCGEVLVGEKDLPVELPDDVDFRPTGESPLVVSKSFHNVKCPKCGETEGVRRESDTMDTFVCSSWYFLRYCDPHNSEKPFDKEKIKNFMPVDLYVGGAEHAVLHLMYARFFTKALRDAGFLNFDEPFLKLRNQGMILAEDGRKMSKSLGNVINPDEIVEKFGADTFRMYEMFMGPLEDSKPWNTNSISGIFRFLEKVWKLSNKKFGSENLEIKKFLHQTIKKVSEDIEAMKFNTAISQMMILSNEMEKAEEIFKQDFENFLKILSPFAPHICEELWEKLGYKDLICEQEWPEFDFELIKEDEVELVIQINGKVRDKIKVATEISEDELKEKVLKRELVQKWIETKKMKKFIYIKGKLVSLVVN